MLTTSYPDRQFQQEKVNFLPDKTQPQKSIRHAYLPKLKLTTVII